MTALSQDYIVAFSSNLVKAGPLGGNLVQVGTGGLAGSVVGSVSSMLMIDPTDGRSKVFAVNGSGQIMVQVDTAAGAVIGGNIEAWANAVVARGVGSLPLTYQIVSTYLGRAVLAAPLLDPQNYAMSRTGNPLDWGFTLDPQATTPIYGRNSKAGVPGDAITSLMVTWDDMLWFGCASSIWAMNGDPSYGGRVDQVSNKTGVLGKHAFTFDSRGNLYVMGSGGLFGVTRGSTNPELIADGSNDNQFRRIDLRDFEVILSHDQVRDYIDIWIAPLDTSPSARPQHWFYDIRNGGLWPRDYPIPAGPISVCEPSSANPEYRYPVMGGLDGKLRMTARAALSDAGKDDGSPGVSSIPTSIRMTPLEAQEGAREIMLTELQATGSVQSGPVTYRVYGGESREDVAQQASTAARQTGTLFGDGRGFQAPRGIRVTAGAVAVELAEDSTDQTWGLERLVAYAELQGDRG